MRANPAWHQQSPDAYTGKGVKGEAFYLPNLIRASAPRTTLARSFSSTPAAFLFDKMKNRSGRYTPGTIQHQQCQRGKSKDMQIAVLH